jgi:hypothetical protein
MVGTKEEDNEEEEEKAPYICAQLRAGYRCATGSWFATAVADRGSTEHSGAARFVCMSWVCVAEGSNK